MGPADAVSRHRFFDVISAEFQYPYQPKFEGESESITQFQHELQRYMDRIVDDRDIEYRSTILRYANGKAISALGPAVLSDVEQMAQTSLPVVGFSRHQPQRAALQALGYWIDPSETRFTPVEKSDMTNILVDRLAVYAADTPHHSDALASAIVDALSHSDSRKAEAALRHWASDPSVSTTFRDVALAAGRAVEKRIQQ
jgi:hypothetical protein